MMPRPPTSGTIGSIGLKTLCFLVLCLMGIAGPAATAPVRAAGETTVVTDTESARAAVPDALAPLHSDAVALRDALLASATRDLPAARKAHDDARAHAARGNWHAAARAQTRAIAARSTNPLRWLDLSRYHFNANEADRQAPLAAYIHGLESKSTADQAAGFAQAADYLLKNDQLAVALALYTRANDLDPSDAVGHAIDALSGRDLSLVRSRVEADRPLARVCLRLTEAPAVGDDVRLRDFVSVDPAAEIAVTAQNEEVCIEGLPHGANTTITLKPGFPGASGARLSKPLPVEAAIPNREPRISFSGDAYILPALGNRAIAVRTINVHAMELTLIRVNERAVAPLLRERSLKASLSGYAISDLSRDMGEEIWQGDLTVESDGRDNEERVTAIDLPVLRASPKPGLYLLAARNKAEDGHRWENRPFQWILITDIGLQAVRGPNGLTVFSRSLATAEPLPGVELMLVARNNDNLGTATTDGAGMAVFPPGLLQGEKGQSAAVVTAMTADRDFAFLNITGPAFDLSDRGVGGRPAPGPIDAYVYTDRGIYRPGETVHAVALVRNGTSAAAANLPVTFKIFRPDGVQAGVHVASSLSGGVAPLAVPTLRSGPTGSWEIRTYIDPAAEPVGRVRFLLEDFAPLTMDLALKPAADTLGLTADAPSSAPVSATVDVAVQADYLYGAPVVKGAVETTVTLSVDPAPFETYKTFSFGLVQESFEPRRIDLPATVTDDTGAANVAVGVPFDRRPDTSHPLRASVRVTVADQTGQAMNRTLVLPVRSQPVMIGIRRGFDDDVAVGQPAAFDLLALSADGTPVTGRPVSWSLIREEHDYVWYRSGGVWSYRLVQNSRRVSGGDIVTGGGGMARLSVPVDWGAYRLEVTDAGGSLSAASVRFRAGWWVAQALERDTPDTLKVVADKVAYRVGDTARFHLSAPFAGQATIQAVNDDVRLTRSVAVAEGGTTVSLPVTEDWGIGAYVVVTAFRPLAEPNGAVPAGDGHTRPTRAMGLVWTPVEDPARILSVSLDLPEGIRPRTTLDLPVRVEGHQGKPVVVTVAAVDEGILQLTDFPSPNPTGYFLGRRALAFDYRDAYGRLLRPAQGRPGRLRDGGDASDRALSGLPESTVQTVSLFSGPLTVDRDGRAVVTFDIPDFNGRLRVMAVAASPLGTGQADGELIVRDPIVALAALPRFLAPGDVSALTVSLDNAEAPAGPLTLRLEAGNGVDIADGDAEQTITIPEKGRAVVRFPLTGGDPGTADLRLSLSAIGPNGERFERISAWTMGVRPGTPRQTSVHALDLPPGGKARFDGLLLAGNDEGSALVGLDVSTVPNLEALRHIAALERYPYECLEQTTARGYAALYAEDLGAAAFRAPGSRDPGDTLAWAVNRIVSLQRADGGFSLWRSGGSLEPWLSAFAVDFLLQVREKGPVAVPDFAIERGLTFMQREVNGTGFDTARLPTIAYYHYVLARAGVNNLSQVRYFHDRHGDRLPTLLARTHTAAALALLGDGHRATLAAAPASGPRGVGGFQPATAVIDVAENPMYWNYGSLLRDQVATLALGIEARLPGFDPFKVMDALALGENRRSSFSTQEQAWLIRAAHNLKTYQGDLTLTIDGRPVPGNTVSRSMTLTPDRLKQGLDLHNTGERMVRAALTIDAQPLEPPPRAENGLTITRSYRTPQGDPVDPATVRRNDVLVAVISGRVTDTRLLHPDGTPLLVVDMLPAGVVISSPAFGGGAGADNLAWLGDITATDHTEARDDRYVAGFKLSPSKPGFRLAYIVRATVPGDYALPGVAAELMDRTWVRGNDAPARLIVNAP